MSHTNYDLDITQANVVQLTEQLIEDFTCPINWDEENIGVASQILLEKWYRVISTCMPNGELDACLLKTSWEEYLHCPSVDTFEENSYDVEELRSLVFNTSRFREEFRSQYRVSCRKFQGIKAQPPEARKKHYPEGSKNLEDVIAWSKKHPDIGILLPNLDIEQQRIMFWAAISNAFERKRIDYQLALKDSNLSEAAVFERSWADLFEVDHLRFACDMMTSVGYSNGKEVDWLLFDASYHAQIVHCYPLAPPNDKFQQAAIDDFQGLINAYLDRI